MRRFDDCSDDFYVNLNLNTEMELQSSRESALHYFEQVNKKYPHMHNFYARESGEYVLEEDKDRGYYRWTSVEPKRICSGAVNPSTYDEAIDLHCHVLEVAPYALSLSALDCESLNVMLGFDFTYRGNHNQLIAEALGITPAFEGLLDLPGATAISYEPSIQFAVDEACRVQIRLSVEPRTSAYHVRVGDFPEDQISVYLMARRYGSLERGQSFAAAAREMGELCYEIAEGYVVEKVLRPLQQTIAMK